MTTEGNHEVEDPHWCGLLLKEPFVAYNSRYKNPSDASGSLSNLYYSYESAGVHWLMLGTGFRV